MGSDTYYTELCTKIGLAESPSLKKIWKLLATEDEAALAVQLPGNAETLAESTGKDASEIQSLLDSLYHKGAIFKTKKDDTLTYKLPKQIVQFHDASLLWDGATDEFFELWKKVMDEDFTNIMKSLPPEVKLPSFMRVIPINETLNPESNIATFEECAAMIESSTLHAVVDCPCRLSQKNCDAPLESCLQLNRGAEYAIDRGHGRKITKEEALKILKISEEHGLVHMTENRVKGNAICNCCSCCCEMFRLQQGSGKDWILSPSRYLAIINESCTACGNCIEICPANAISLNDIAEVNKDSCIGCGLCASHCPVEAIGLNEIREKEHIPGA